MEMLSKMFRQSASSDQLLTSDRNAQIFWRWFLRMLLGNVSSAFYTQSLSIAPALSWINGKPGGVSLWMAHKTIYGINANIILGWRHKFSHLHAFNLGNDFWSSSTRQRPGAWMRSDMCFCLCYRCAFGFLAYNKCHLSWELQLLCLFDCLLRWVTSITALALANKYL